MSTRRVQFFMMPDEFASFVDRQLGSLGVDLIGVAGGTLRSLSPVNAQGPLFVAPHRNVWPSTMPIRPGREGWLVVQPPRVEGKMLYLAELAAKSEWDDPDTGITAENPAVGRLYSRVAKMLRPMLVFPVVAINETTGRSHTCVRIGYSIGAQRWLVAGGSWRQMDVNNVRFNVPVAS